MRPVLAHLCSYRDLIVPGALSLLDLEVMNEALDVQEVNRAISSGG